MSDLELTIRNACSQCGRPLGRLDKTSGEITVYSASYIENQANTIRELRWAHREIIKTIKFHGGARNTVELNCWAIAEKALKSNQGDKGTGRGE